jgi:uncharacterized protein
MSDQANTQAPPQPGTFCWNELMTPDAGKAREFYTKLLGWTTETMDMGEHGTYTIVKSGEQSVGGIMEMKGAEWEGLPPHWMGYIAVDDIDASTNRVKELGGEVCVPVTPIPNIGRFSVVQDPTGAKFALFST